MKTEIKSIPKAGLLPTASHIETFSNALEEYGLGHGPKNLHKLLVQFNELANVQSDYFVCRQAPMVDIAKHLADLDLSIVSCAALDTVFSRNVFLNVDLSISIWTCNTGGQIYPLLEPCANQKRSFLAGNAEFCSKTRIGGSCWTQQQTLTANAKESGRLDTSLPYL